MHFPGMHLRVPPSTRPEEETLTFYYYRRNGPEGNIRPVRQEVPEVGIYCAPNFSVGLNWIRFRHRDESLIVLTSISRLYFFFLFNYKWYMIYIYIFDDSEICKLVFFFWINTRWKRSCSVYIERYIWNNKKKKKRTILPSGLVSSFNYMIGAFTLKLISSKFSVSTLSLCSPSVGQRLQMRATIRRNSTVLSVSHGKILLEVKNLIEKLNFHRKKPRTCTVQRRFEFIDTAKLI